MIIMARLDFHADPISFADLPLRTLDLREVEHAIKLREGLAGVFRASIIPNYQFIVAVSAVHGSRRDRHSGPPGSRMTRHPEYWFRVCNKT